MAQNNAVSVVSLDFDEIKASLKSYLQSQSVLKDYNFDGSVLNTILDVLAYNTHYQAFYSNMIANEMFLDSAVLRSSVVSHAKALNYVPSSTTPSRAVVDVVLTAPASSDTYLPRGTEFSGTNPAGTRYKFVNLDTEFVSAGATAFSAVTLYEGSIRRITYIYNRDTRIGSHLIIPNDKADMSSLSVRVYKSVADTTGITDIWTNAADYLTLDSTSKVYFLQERDPGIFEVYFGDGVLGTQPETGNVVVLEYLETNGSDANGVNAFTKSDSSIDYIEFTADNPQYTYGGSDLESNSSIKRNAPKFYQSGNRAVTESDYAALIFKNYPNVSSLNVYGGETVTPPQYGKVFVAIKPKSGGILTTGEKVSIEQDLRRRNSIVTITPKIIDPDYIDLVIDANMVYSPDALPVGIGVLKSLAMTYIYGYSKTKIEQFGEDFYFSKVMEGLNNIHTSILGVSGKIKLRKIVDIDTILKSKSYEFRFGNSLYHPHDGHSSIVSSNIFSHTDIIGNTQTDCTLADNGSGVLNIVRPDPNSIGNYITVYPSVGTVDYTNGVVTVNSKFLPISAATGSTSFPIIVTVEPEDTNIYIKENQILRINPIYYDSVTVTTTSKTEADALNSVR